MQGLVSSIKIKNINIVLISAAALLVLTTGIWPAQEQQVETQKQNHEKALRSSGLYKAGQLLEKTAKNGKNEGSGEINTLVIGGSGQVQYAVFSHGGMFGIGGDISMAAMTWEVLQLSPEADYYILNVDITKDQLSDISTL